MTETSGAVSAPNQHSLEAAAEMFARGGNAVDAAVAAQVVVAVTMPQSAGVGGDMLALVRLPDGPAGPSDPAGPVSPDGPDGPVRALNGTGRSPAHWTTCGNGRPGDTVTVPGAVLGWWELCRAFGRLPCADVLAPALRLARDGIVVDERLAGAAAKQRDRVLAASPDSPIGDLTQGVTWRQPQLAALLQRIADEGPAAFYEGAAANAIAAAAERAGDRSRPPTSPPTSPIRPPSRSRSPSTGPAAAPTCSRPPPRACCSPWPCAGSTTDSTTCRLAVANTCSPS